MAYHELSAMTVRFNAKLYPHDLLIQLKQSLHGWRGAQVSHRFCCDDRRAANLAVDVVPRKQRGIGVKAIGQHTEPALDLLYGPVMRVPQHRGRAGALAR